MTDQIEQLLKSVKARTGPELQSELETLSEEIDELRTENEQLREEKASLQTELEKTTQGTLQLASELEQEYQHLYESAVEGIYKTTADLDKYVLANPAFADLLGYESEEAVCEAIDSIEEDVFVDSDRYEQYAETLDADGELNQFEYQVRTAEGETRWVSDSVRALRDDQGGAEGYRGAVIDITEKKTQEVELERQTQLSIVLNRVLRHNLRNDISVVRGYTQLMADQLDDTTYEEKALNTIDSLVKLSEKARVLDKIISNDADPEPTDIPAVVEAVASQMGEKNPSATISVETPDEGVTTEAIPSFKRAIEEIVENAVKHSGDSPRVEITIEANPKDIQIRIADSGPGIGEQDASVLLSESETPLKHGSGLGLWLINWIVTSVGGVIDVTATEEGTTLSVSIPRTPSEGNQKQMTDMVRARDQYKSAFEEAGDGITITNDEGHILDLNNKAAQSFGEDREAMIGRPIREFMPEEFDFVAEWGENQAAEMKRGEIQIATADGGVSPIEYTAKSHFVPSQHLIVSRDISERKEREQEIKELKNQLQGILDTAAAAIFVKDSDGRYLQMNRHSRDMFGVSEADVSGLTDDDLFPEDVAAQYQADDERVIENNESTETEEEVPTEDGTRTYLTRKAPISDKDGNTSALVAVATDITERKERQRRYEAIFNQTNKFTGLLEPDGTVIEANDPALEFGGLDREDVVGKQFHEADWWQHDDAIQQELQDAIDRAAAGEFVRYEVEVQGSEENTTIDFSIRPITDEQGNVTVLVPEGRDITERKQYVDDLERKTHRLEQFVNIVSHDLRNPLNVAMSRTQLAQDEYDSDHLGITMEAIGRMESIIEDSLGLARKGQPVAEREWIQMQSFLADCWEMVETPDCSLDIDDRFEVDGERSRLKHVFENLFRNSVEHSNGKSVVRVGLLDATGFYIEDDGPGIPEDDRKKVLDAGFTTNEDGTGFGLAIVNRIAVAHGWDLTIADGIDGGVRFEFSNVDLQSQSEIPSN